jgi:hypothetical protein
MERERCKLMLSGRVGRLDISSSHQMKKYRTAGKVPKSNRKIVERDKVVTLSTHIHDLSCSGTGTSLESGGFNLVLWSNLPIHAQNLIITSPFYLFFEYYRKAS